MKKHVLTCPPVVILSAAILSAFPPLVFLIIILKQIKPIKITTINNNIHIHIIPITNFAN